MAFTGTAVVTYVSDSLVRITGLSLAQGDSGTIGLAGDATADVELPAAFQPTPYGTPSGTVVELADAIEVSYWLVDNGVTIYPAIAVTKGGDPFQISMENVSSDSETGDVEIYVRWHN